MKKKVAPTNKNYQLHSNRPKNLNNFLKVRTPYLANVKGDDTKKRIKKKLKQDKIFSILTNNQAKRSSQSHN